MLHRRPEQYRSDVPKVDGRLPKTEPELGKKLKVQNGNIYEALPTQSEVRNVLKVNFRSSSTSNRNVKVLASSVT